MVDADHLDVIAVAGLVDVEPSIAELAEHAQDQVLVQPTFSGDLGACHPGPDVGQLTVISAKQLHGQVIDLVIH